MEAFTLDTSGAVHETQDNPPRFYPCPCRWSDLDPFTQGYGERMARELFERLISVGVTEAAALQAVAFSNWAPETLAAILEDCEHAQSCVLEPNVQTYGDGPESGRTFWSQRQAGKLPAHPPLTAYLGDDGKVYLRGVGS